MKNSIRHKVLSGISAAVMLLNLAIPVPVSAAETQTALTKENAMKSLNSGITISADRISTENYKDTDRSGI